MSNRIVQISIALMVGLVVGGLVGRMTAPPIIKIESAKTASESTKAKTAPETGIGDVVGLMGRAEELIDSEAGEGLSAVGDILNAASVTDLLDWSRSPETVSRRIINEMSDDELVSTITSITKIEAHDLDEVSDLREYAGRLTKVAMSGIITDDLSDEFDNRSLNVEFGTDASSSRGAEDPSIQFEISTRKIYAVIPNQGDGAENVMVHWYRVDQPENLLFDQYKVSPEDDYSYVWLKSPGRWTEGDYRVEFFTADEQLTPIGSGSYRIVGE